jgi:hypothetical protein
MDRARPTALFPALALSVTALAAAVVPQPARAWGWGCLTKVEVYDRAQSRNLPQHRKHGQRWVAGEPGHEYELKLRNCTSVRVLAVVSVDGVNVITGQSASPAQSGYVLEPGQSITVDGWRKSMAQTAAFVFTDPADSYAARTGRPGDLGVIGLALFREAAPRIIAPGPGNTVYSAPAAREESSAQGAAAKDEAEPDRRERSASLGTGHGRRGDSPAQWASFERASDTPDEVIRIRYETHSALVALGVLPYKRYPDRGPEPFPAQLGFVPDP